MHTVGVTVDAIHAVDLSVDLAVNTVDGTIGHAVLLSLVGGGLGGGLDIVVDQGLAGDVLDLDALSGLGVDGVASVAGVDESLNTGTLARVVLHLGLVLAKGGVHLLGVDIVQEDARSERSRDSSTELTVTSLVLLSAKVCH